MRFIKNQDKSKKVNKLMVNSQYQSDIKLLISGSKFLPKASSKGIPLGPAGEHKTQNTKLRTQNFELNFMCGRFSFSPLTRIIEDRFDVKVNPGQYTPRFNSAPSQDLAVISNVKQDELSYYKWGLIPFWAKDKSIGNKMINAKAETITEKVSFKNSFNSKRCLVLSDGFYEWKKINPKEKIPYRIKMEDGSLFAMAGIWDTWKNEEGNLIDSFAIITTSPNELMENIHTRMPVILDKKDENAWLNETDTEFLQSLLKPFPAKYMTAYSISKLVNYPKNDSQEIQRPVEYNL